MKTLDTPTTSDWMALVSKYQSPSTGAAVRQLLNSFLPYIGMWVLMVFSLQVGYWLTLLLAIPTAGLLVRIFIIQHDCGHGSFLASQKVSDRIGFVCGVLTFTPYRLWRLSHAIHHAGASNLEKRGTGDIWTLTIDEFRALSPLMRAWYRLYRNPLFLFGVGSFVNFVILQRITFSPQLRKEWASIHWTNLGIAVLAVALILLVGWQTYLAVQVTIMVFASVIGTWLFYVQHQFEDTYWAHDAEWDFAPAALQGSSYYKLPAVLRWFTGNIGFHHIHHLSPMIPNYKLRQCHEENPEFHVAPVLTLRESFRTASLRLWDEEQQRLIRFADLRT